MRHSEIRSNRARLSLMGLAFAGALSCSGPPEVTAVTSQASRIGQPGTAQWSAPVSLAIVPVAGASLPDGRVLFWSADSPLDFSNPGQTYTVLFNPVTMTASEQLVTATGHDMFCPGTANLADGRILVNGGMDSDKTSIYDPAKGSWSIGPGMNIPRGYEANTLTWNGAVFTLGGSWSGGTGGKNGEIWTAAGGWQLLPGVPVAPMLTADPEGVYRSDNHMWLISTGTGRLLQAGPSQQMNWIDTAGSGSTWPAGVRGDDGDAMCGNAVMYDVGLVLKVGGAPAYENANASPNAYVIDVTRGATVRKIAPMAYARSFHNSVVLPNGQVVVMGGQTVPVPFSDDDSVLVPELWDPATEAFTPLPPMAVPRNYHSIALLLPDGRVLSAGGGLCGGCATNHTNLQILTPSYLLNQDGTAAARPAITSAPSVIAYGSRPQVTTSGPVSAFALMRIGSATHTVDNDQRRIPLAFTSAGTNRYALAIPSNPGIALPGYYMLFTLDADGVPSTAKTLRIDPSRTPVLTPPGDPSASVGTAVSFALSATAPGGPSSITFGASGLPPGLTLNAPTGMVTGVPTTAGTYPGTVSASNAAGSVSFDLTWTVGSGGTTGGAVRYVKLVELTEVNGHPWGSMSEFNVLDASGNPLPRSGWTVSADSQETAAANNAAVEAIDGNPATFWHTQWSTANPPPPHSYTVDLGSPQVITGFTYLSRQDGEQNGSFARFQFFVSSDGSNWGTPVVQGDFTTMGAMTALKTITLPGVPPKPPSPPTTVTTRYVELEELTEVNGNPWASMSEFNVLDASGNPLPRSAWTVRADSQETAADNNAAVEAIDGNPATFWHTQWSTANPPPPHFYIVDFGSPQTITGFTYLSRQDGEQNGSFARFQFFVSSDGSTWGSPVIQGDFTTMGAMTALKTVTLP
jgi:hypothetical protein